MAAPKTKAAPRHFAVKPVFLRPYSGWNAPAFRPRFWGLRVSVRTRTRFGA